MKDNKMSYEKYEAFLKIGTTNKLLFYNNYFHFNIKSEISVSRRKSVLT